MFYLPFSHCVKELVSLRISDVETVTPHAVVGYCILSWLTSTQDVPTELLEGSFVVKWIDCFRAVCLCMCVWASLCAVNKICFYPQTMADRVLLCVWRLHPHFSMGYWVWWVVMATGETLFTMILFLFLLNKERNRMQIDSPYQQN